MLHSRRKLHLCDRGLFIFLPRSGIVCLSERRIGMKKFFKKNSKTSSSIDFWLHNAMQSPPPPPPSLAFLDHLDWLVILLILLPESIFENDFVMLQYFNISSSFSKEISWCWIARLQDLKCKKKKSVEFIKFLDLICRDWGMMVWTWWWWCGGMDMVVLRKWWVRCGLSVDAEICIKHIYKTLENFWHFQSELYYLEYYFIIWT